MHGRTRYCLTVGLHLLQVVRKAVHDGTLRQLASKAKAKAPSRRAAGGKLPPLSAVAAPVPPAQLPQGTVRCALCSQPKRQDEIAVTVGGEAFCTTCDHIRRRANNLGIQTKEVTAAFRSGALAGPLGLTEEQLRAQIGLGPSSCAAGGGAAAGKAGSLGRMCRMCRQVRAPIVGVPHAALERWSCAADGVKGKHETCCTTRCPVLHAVNVHTQAAGGVQRGSGARTAWTAR